MRRAARARTKELSEARNLPLEPTSEGIWPGGSTGVPSTRRMWQPTSRPGLARAMETASSKKAPVAMRVAEESAPARWSSAMERLTPGVSPKSSALTMRGTDQGTGLKERDAGGPGGAARSRRRRMVRPCNIVIAAMVEHCLLSGAGMRMGDESSEGFQNGTAFPEWSGHVTSGMKLSTIMIDEGTKGAFATCCGVNLAGERRSRFGN